MQILQLQKHSGISTVLLQLLPEFGGTPIAPMGVPPNSGNNCSNFDHITMARIAEQRLDNLWKDFSHYQSDLETKQIILNFRFWLSTIKIIYMCYKCEAW